MRIEKRGDGEWLVDIEGDMSDCAELSPKRSVMCTRHLNGEHISGGHSARDGAIYVIERWAMDTSTEVEG